MTLNETWLCEAIQGRRVVSLWYDGGMRECAPFAIGKTTAGNVAVRCWQLSGFSKSAEPMPGWRLFRVDGIKNLLVLDREFLDFPPGYNPNDKKLSPLWLSIPLPG